MSESKLEPLHLKARIYAVLCTMFMMSLLVSDIIAGKFFVFGSVVLSAGTVTFPIVFLLNDVVNEYYGKQAAQFLTWIGMLGLLIGYALILVATQLPVAPKSPVPQEAMAQVFGFTGRLVLASLSAYLIGQWADIHIFHKLKSITSHKWLWARALGSTLISQVIDTAVVNAGVLWGVMNFDHILGIAFVSYLYKMVVALLLTPIIYVFHHVLTNKWGIPTHVVIATNES